MALKIPLLLVQFLYKNRRLALPGVGIFTLDKSIVLPEEDDHALLSLPNAVQFQNAHIVAADKELITYICENTGKIKPLAISDLESYLNLGMEMLNIGKPFYLEGIGTITKNKAGNFDFSPAEHTLMRENHPPGSADHARKKRQESDPPVSSLQLPQNRNLLRGVAIIAALIIVGWGGYLMYKKASPVPANNLEANTAPVSAPAADTVTKNLQSDSAKMVRLDSAHHNAAGKDSTDYKFVILATPNKSHALRRYRQLISFDLKAYLFQKDSSFFKVYFQFPALSKDTIRIKDSLKRQYAHEVNIEQ